MPRARNIKPGFFKNEKLGTADPFVSLLFAGLWTLADKAGVLEDRPLRIRAELFPYRDNFDINGYLTVLVRLEFIHRYVINGNGYIQIINFKKHQHPHHTEKDSEFPEYSNGCELTDEQPLNNGYAPSDLLIPDSLIPDSRIKKKNTKKESATAAYLTVNFPDDVNQQVVIDFIKLRKAKKSPLTQTALNGIEREAVKAGISLQTALETCCQRGWVGFKAEWFESKVVETKATRDQQAKEWLDRATGKTTERDITGECHTVDMGG